ncbi:uncharacterized protein LOC115770621 isoform X2 [Drosophila novamexicana]|uniref:uncharacterized protein LOC115770621 isoform X2 n=1 Tax=Drosophila novamexicana TaxID=47314 RepID=UPI0011E5C0EC|nr:uncharacterized protein LOC115770621 isoform X2 [Drosophila novamexicana]
MHEPSISDPMSFLYLDMLSNLLLEDAKEIGKEFDIKMNFIRQQERNCLENAKQFIEAMKECLFQTELELQEYEADLLNVEKYISRYEASSIDFPKGPDPIRLMPRSYLVFLKLLLSADCSAAQCNNLRAELDQYNNEALKCLDSPKVITKIMDYHLKTLNLLEKKLNSLQSLSDNVAKSYDQMANKLKISSLSTKCTCKMANIINDIRMN